MSVWKKAVGWMSVLFPYLHANQRLENMEVKPRTEGTGGSLTNFDRDDFMRRVEEMQNFFVRMEKINGCSICNN